MSSSLGTRVAPQASQRPGPGGVGDQVVVHAAARAEPPGQHPAPDLAVGHVEVDHPVDVVALQEELGLALVAGEAVDDEAVVPVVLAEAVADDAFDQVIPTSTPAAIVRLTWAPSLVWCWMFQRKMSPTLMWTRSRSVASILACVPLPLPWTPMITYLRTGR